MDKCTVYPVSFDGIATVALNHYNCSQTVETEMVPLIYSLSVRGDSERKYFGGIVNDKDQKVITSKLKEGGEG